jgi:hypothetical protein
MREGSLAGKPCIDGDGGFAFRPQRYGLMNFLDVVHGRNLLDARLACVSTRLIVSLTARD